MFTSSSIDNIAKYLIKIVPLKYKIRQRKNSNLLELIILVDTQTKCLFSIRIIPE